MKKKYLLIISCLFAAAILIFFLFCNNTRLANPQTQAYYHQLKETLEARGYKPSLLVVSTSRASWYNNLLVRLSGAAPKSHHIKGEAIDFIVFDVNEDGKSDAKDVDLVHQILDKEIIKNNGGLGTYKNEGSFFYQQMIHIDCRGYRGRWSHS